MDFFSDQGALLVKLHHDQPLPDFVKQGEMNTEYSVDHLPATSFADPARRLYPCHTPADTYVSALYYHAKHAADPAVEGQLRRFARIHGVDDAVDDARRVAVAHREKTASRANVKRAAVAPREWSVSAPSVKMAGLGAGSLKRAAEEFIAGATEYPFADRQAVAEQLLKAAGDQGAEVPFELNVYSGTTLVDTERLRSALTKRALYLADPNDRRALILESDTLQNVGTCADVPTFGAKMAEFLDVFDRDHGLVRHYGRGLPDPHRSVFSPEPKNKTAALLDTEIIVNGRTIKVADVDEQVGRWALGDDFTPERLLNLTAAEERRLNQYL